MCSVNIKDIDVIFVTLTHHLKDNDAFFDEDKMTARIERTNKFEGEYLAGGIFDIFIRKCCLSFSKMMFENVAELHDNYQAYINGEDFKFQHAKTSLLTFVDEKLRKFESEVTIKSHEELKDEFNRINVPLDYKKHLLHSMNDSYSGYSIPAIENLRKFIDHSLVDINKSSELNYSTHNSLIPLSSLHIRLGNLDEGLISLIE